MVAIGTSRVRVPGGSPGDEQGRRLGTPRDRAGGGAFGSRAGAAASRPRADGKFHRAGVLQ